VRRRYSFLGDAGHLSLTRKRFGVLGMATDPWSFASIVVPTNHILKAGGSKGEELSGDDVVSIATTDIELPATSPPPSPPPPRSVMPPVQMAITNPKHSTQKVENLWSSPLEGFGVEVHCNVHRDGCLLYIQ
jgi:hypothetical protein